MNRVPDRPLGKVLSLAVFLPLLAQTIVVPDAAAQSNAALSAPPMFLSTQSDGWRLLIAPYLWGSGLRGEVAVQGNSAELDIGFRTILENLDFAFMLPAELRRGRWGIATEIIYLRLSKGAAIPRRPEAGVAYEQSQLVWELTPRYRALRAEAVDIDLIAGFRYVNLKPTLTLMPANAPSQEFGEQQSWTDPVVGARLLARPGGAWMVDARGDVGGFGVGSEFAWQALLLLGYHFNDSVGLLAGYRRVDIEYQQPTDDLFFDVATSGPILGVLLTF